MVEKMNSNNFGVMEYYNNYDKADANRLTLMN